MRTVHTMEEAHRAIARALDEGDERGFDRVDREVADWMIPDREREAFAQMMESIRSVMYSGRGAW